MVFSQVATAMERREFIRKRGQLYYKPIQGRFLFSILFHVINHDDSTGFDIEPILGITNMNVNFLCYKIDENYIYSNDFFFSGFIPNVGQMAEGRYKDWQFSIDSNDSLKSVSEMITYVLDACEVFLLQVCTPNDFITYAIDSNSIDGIAQALLMYYCCNRRDLGLKYLENLRGERLERLMKNWNRNKVELFFSRYEHELPEDPEKLLKQVPAFCKKRKIVIKD